MSFLRQFFSRNPYSTDSTSSGNFDSSSTTIEIGETSADVLPTTATTESAAAVTTYSALRARLSNYASQVTHCVNARSFHRLQEETSQDNENSENDATASNCCSTLLAQFAEIYNSLDRVDRICFSLAIASAIGSSTSLAFILAGYVTAGKITSLGSAIIGLPSALSLFVKNCEKVVGCKEERTTSNRL